MGQRTILIKKCSQSTLVVVPSFILLDHSWEKETVENILGLAREYLPKEIDPSTITQEKLSWIAEQ